MMQTMKNRLRSGLVNLHKASRSPSQTDDCNLTNTIDHSANAINSKPKETIGKLKCSESRLASNKESASVLYKNILSRSSIQIANTVDKLERDVSISQHVTRQRAMLEIANETAKTFENIALNPKSNKRKITNVEQSIDNAISDGILPSFKPQTRRSVAEFSTTTNSGVTSLENDTLITQKSNRRKSKNDEQSTDNVMSELQSSTESHTVQVTTADSSDFVPNVFQPTSKSKSIFPLIAPFKTVPKGWDLHFAALLEYGNEHGHCNVPYHAAYECNLVGISYDGGSYHYTGKLGYWLSSQRQAKKGIYRSRKPEREAELQKLVDEGKLVWEMDGISQVSKKQGELDWPRHYAALLQYCEEYGSCNAPSNTLYSCILPKMGDHGEDYHYHGKLGSWLKNQRQSRRGISRSKLTPEREFLLQTLVEQGKLHWKSVGVVSLATQAKSNADQEWKRNYAALLEYEKENHSCDVPFDDTVYEYDLPETLNENGGVDHYNGKLGIWIAKQCKAWKARLKAGNKSRHSKLTDQNVILLQSLVDSGKLSWNSSKNIRFRPSRKRNSKISDKSSSNINSVITPPTENVNVVAAITTTLNKSNTNQKQSSKDKDWPKHYAALLNYYQEHGTCNVPQKTYYETELQGFGENGENYHYVGHLGLWLANQRRCKRGLRCALTPLRDAMLQSLVDGGKLAWELREQKQVPKRLSSSHYMAPNKRRKYNKTPYLSADQVIETIASIANDEDLTVIIPSSNNDNANNDDAVQRVVGVESDVLISREA